MVSTSNATWDPSAEIGSYNELVEYWPHIGRRFVLGNGTVAPSLAYVCGWDGLWSPDPGLALPDIECKHDLNTCTQFPAMIEF